jgi:hypothetical protein
MSQSFQNHLILAAKMVPVLLGTVIVALGCLYMYQHRDADDEPDDTEAQAEEASNPWQSQFERVQATINAPDRQYQQPPVWTPPPLPGGGSYGPGNAPASPSGMAPRGGLR